MKIFIIIMLCIAFYCIMGGLTHMFYKHDPLECEFDNHDDGGCILVGCFWFLTLPYLAGITLYKKFTGEKND